MMSQVNQDAFLEGRLKCHMVPGVKRGKKRWYLASPAAAEDQGDGFFLTGGELWRRCASTTRRVADYKYGDVDSDTRKAMLKTLMHAIHLCDPMDHTFTHQVNILTQRVAYVTKVWYTKLTIGQAMKFPKGPKRTRRRWKVRLRTLTGIYPTRGKLDDGRDRLDTFAQQLHYLNIDMLQVENFWQLSEDDMKKFLLGSLLLHRWLLTKDEETLALTMDCVHGIIDRVNRMYLRDLLEGA